MTEQRAGYGWESDFPAFRAASLSRIREDLKSFVGDASAEQVRAWSDSIPPLQAEVDEILVRDSLASNYSAILEYELPLDSRRPDVLLLVGAGVLVVELKGKTHPTQADLDQASAYARDLKCYHRECHERPVVPVLVPTRARGRLGEIDGVMIAGPDAIDGLVSEMVERHPRPIIDRSRFLSSSAYCPLPTLVQAARELFVSQTVRTIHRAKAATDPAVEEISRIIHTAALTRSRHLILVTGVPGAGKTLVGLRTVHAKYLDDLSVDRGNGRPTAPAVFLSGNGPLVEVLQYELRSAGGGGRTFVRGVRDYVKRYAGKRHAIPDEHVLVFDEAQRAFDADKMADTHGGAHARSEPEQFVEFANRVPEWCVVVGLIGSGQEIHVGEEAGVGQWLDAVDAAKSKSDWTVHAPPRMVAELGPRWSGVDTSSALSLDTELRFHAASDLHTFVAGLLAGQPAGELCKIAKLLERSGYHLRLTRSLDAAKAYLRERYADHHSARFGLLASSKDKELVNHGVDNDFQATKQVKFGPWYGDDEDEYTGLSCRRFAACVTEFGAQGLELDAALVAWGTDFIRDGGRWSNDLARGYLKRRTNRASVRDPFQLRLNAYRVLLTRGRDASVVFVPNIRTCDETYAYLVESGFKVLER